jgi:hypothetical protein
MTDFGQSLQLTNPRTPEEHIKKDAEGNGFVQMDEVADCINSI